jgi:acyl-CoA reductase-like NAD-dependent aldehyde dehydrogenase
VVREVADEFLEGVIRRTNELTVGDPMRWETESGPMVSIEQFETVSELVDDAMANGAERLTGGPTEVPGFSGRFIAPTVLAGVEDGMRIMREEIFGPVVPIVTVESEEEAVERANDSSFGLGASVWTRDRARGERMARRIASGMVWINDHSYTHAAMQCSWGGVKDSGLGRSHSKFGLYECTEVKLVAWEPGRTRNMWWQPYDETLGRALRASARLIYGRDGQRVKALREGGVALVKVGARTLRK